MSEKVRTIADHGINWMWYLCGSFDEEAKTVRIHYHERWHKWDDAGNHPVSEIGGFRIVEGNGRVATAVRVGEITYAVTNPLYVFDYKDFTHYVPEGGK